MRKTLISLFAVLLLWSINEPAVAQDQSSQTPPATEGEQPKSELQKMLDEAESRGEPILGACLEDCTNSAFIEGLERGRPLMLPKPAYPAIARAGRASGQVVIKVIVGLDGTVLAASAVSGHPLLLATSLKAARESLFAPWKFNGEPIKVVGVIGYNFVRQ